jgi:nucleoside-diphosphate-sugar epimerase
MRVVVVGATGNVGSALMRRLDREDHEVVAVARRPPSPEWIADHGCEWHAADIADDPLDVLAGADVVVHLAWLIQPSRLEPLMRRTNVEGTRRVVEAVVRHRVPALVVASSVGAYSPGPKTPVTETHPARGIPSSTYSRHKAAVESMLDHIEREHPELRLVRMRTSLVFQRDAASEVHRLFLGPLVPWHLPKPLRLVPRVPRLVFQATHADDIAEAYALTLASDARGPFNVAADPVLRPEVIANAVEGRAVRVPSGALRAAMWASYHARLQPAEPGWLDMALQTPVMDTTRVRQELGWHPQWTAIDALVDLLDGIGAGAGDGTAPLRPRRSGLVGKLRHAGREALEEATFGRPRLEQGGGWDAPGGVAERERHDDDVVQRPDDREELRDQVDR